MKAKKKLRRANRRKSITKGCMVYLGERKGIYQGMEGTLALVQTSVGMVKVPFKNLKKDMEEKNGKE